MNVLQEAKQQIDPRLQEMVRYGGGGGGRYGGRGWGRGGGRGMYSCSGVRLRGNFMLTDSEQVAVVAVVVVVTTVVPTTCLWAAVAGEP